MTSDTQDCCGTFEMVPDKLAPSRTKSDECIASEIDGQVEDDEFVSGPSDGEKGEKAGGRVLYLEVCFKLVSDFQTCRLMMGKRRRRNENGWRWNAQVIKTGLKKVKSLMEASAFFVKSQGKSGAPLPNQFVF